MEINYRVLKGRHITLEPLKAEHSEIIRVLAKDQRIWAYTKTLLVDDRYDERFDQYFSIALDETNMIAQKSFIIRRTKDDAIIGSTRYYNIEPSQKRLSIGYTWYVPEVWGGVENKECKYLLLKYAFEESGFQRVQFDVAHQNLRSQKAVEKIGGVREGVLRKHGLHADGTIRDTVVFSITDDEWPAVKQRLEGIISEAG